MKIVYSLTGSKRTITTLSANFLDTGYETSQQEVYEKAKEAVWFLESILKIDSSQQTTTCKLTINVGAFLGTVLASSLIWAKLPNQYENRVCIGKG